MSRLNKYFQQYLSTKVIFAIDLVLSVMASAVVMLSLAFFAKTGSDYYRGMFSLWWMTSSIVGTVVGMLVFKSYNVVVRHMTLPDIIHYILVLLVKVVIIGIVICIAEKINNSIGIRFFAILVFLDLCPSYDVLCV